MREERFWVPGRVLGLNDIIALRASRYRGAYNKAKREFESRIVAGIRAANVTAWPSGAHVRYELVEATKRRDPSNVLAGAMKAVEDALQVADVLDNDGWRHVLGISATWRIDRDAPGVLVTLSDSPHAGTQLAV